MSESELLQNVFLNEVPMIDVRAEIEFARGAFPGAVNFPILTDEERRLVGISYKDNGPEQAERLGYELVSGRQRELRINNWLEFIDRNTGVYLYCFRGGKRSQIACEWLKDAGRNIPRVPGGYKSMRRFLLGQFDKLPKMILVSGKTGVGKTELLASMEHSLDLEHHAHHRGSAFGKRLDQQPSQIGFENAVAIELLKFKDRCPLHHLFVEDEGRSIGRIQVPHGLQAAMKQAPIVLLEDTIENRVNRIYDEYIVCQWRQYSQRFSGQAFEEFSDYLTAAVDAIRKRLGGAGYSAVRKLLTDAITEQKSGNFECHKYWIWSLLEDYYDPMYSYQLNKKTDRIIYHGSMGEILKWANRPDNYRHG